MTARMPNLLQLVRGQHQIVAFAALVLKICILEEWHPVCDFEVTYVLCNIYQRKIKMNSEGCVH